MGATLIQTSVSLILYLTMIAGAGGWAAWQWLVNGGKGVAFMLGAFPALLGAYLVWTDFISPSRNAGGGGLLSAEGCRVAAGM